MFKKLLRSAFALSAGLLLIAATAHAQSGTIKGHVIDQSTNKPLIGANVLIKSLSKGAATDAAGNFTISDVPYGTYQLRVTYIGYRTKTVTVTVDSPTENIEISMQSKVGELNQLVVTGLASSIKRSNLANSVAKVSAKELTAGTVPTTIGNALSGKVAGLKLNSWSGAPGGGVSMQLRGISTLGAGASQPLIILDGVYLDNRIMTTGRGNATGAIASEDNAANRLADINPANIKSITVLKGPSAAAIYGQRANAGVIIIKTKRGQAGETHVSFDEGIGFNTALRFIGRAHWNPTRIKAQWDGSKPGLSDRAKLELHRYNKAMADGHIPDLEKVFYGGKGLVSNTQISVSGGNRNTRFFISGNLDHEEGIIQTTGFKRKSLRANIDHDITDAIHIKSSSSFIHALYQRGFTNNQNGTGGSIGYDLAKTPNYAYWLLNRRPDGTFPDNPYYGENPFRLQYKAVNNQTVNRFLQSASINADLFKIGASVLSLNLQGGLDYTNIHSKIYFPNTFESQKKSKNPGEVIYTYNRAVNVNLEAVLKFNTLVKSGVGSFNLGTQLGVTRFNYNTSANRITGQGLIPGQTNIRNASRVTPGQTFTKGTDVGFFGQQKINWNDILIATVGARLDRSTLNLDQDEYYFFPKASLAINVTNFEFWTGDLFDQLKLRVAYGETGGLPSFGATFVTLGTTHVGKSVGTLTPLASVDPNLQPESANGLEFGLDLAMLNQRVSLSVTHYNKTVTNLILSLSPAPSTGLTSLITNAATLQNLGWELSLKATPVQSNHVVWNTTILWWTNKTTMTELNIPPKFNNLYFVSTRFKEGVSPTAAWGRVIGKPGKTKLGNFQPDYEATWTNSISWNNFNLRFNWHTSQGFVVSNLSTLLADAVGNSAGYWKHYPDHLPKRLSLGVSAPRFLQDGSYIRLQSAALYYTLPDNVLQNLFGNTLSSFRVGVSGRNLLLITDYTGYDPNVSANGRNALGRKLAVTPYPSTTKYMFHISLDF